jgi:signal peptide peptidase SppA
VKASTPRAIVFRPGDILAVTPGVVSQLQAGGGRLTPADLRTFAASGKATTRTADSRPGGIAVVPIYGLMTQQWGWDTGTSSAWARSQVNQLAASPDVAGIMLLVHSPGGEVYGVRELAAAVRDARKVKPVVAAVSSLAASAAFWAISGADSISVTPGGDVGSVGVYGAHQDISGAMEKAGVRVEFISAGEGKTDGNPYGPLSQGARAELQGHVDETYADFVRDVARGRGVPEATVRGVWKARVVGAREAVQLGMADRIETVEAALARLGATAARHKSERAAARAAEFGPPAGASLGETEAWVFRLKRERLLGSPAEQETLRQRRAQMEREVAEIRRRRA